MESSSRVSFRSFYIITMRSYGVIIIELERSYLNFFKAMRFDMAHNSKVTTPVLAWVIGIRLLTGRRGRARARIHAARIAVSLSTFLFPGCPQNAAPLPKR